MRIDLLAPALRHDGLRLLTPLDAADEAAIADPAKASDTVRKKLIDFEELVAGNS